MKKILTRLGIAGIIIWALLQGGYTLYKNYQHGKVKDHFTKVVEYANEYKFPQALEELEKIINMTEASDAEKSMAKLLQKMIIELQNSPNQQEILDSLNTIVVQSNILEKNLVEESKKKGQTANKKLEKQKIALLQQLQEINNIDTSLMSPEEKSRHEAKKLAILNELQQVMSQIQKGRPQPSFVKNTNPEKLNQAIAALKKLNLSNEAKMKKAQRTKHRNKKGGLISQIEKEIKNLPNYSTAEEARKKSLLQQLKTLHKKDESILKPKARQRLKQTRAKLLTELEKLVQQQQLSPEARQLQEIKNAKLAQEQKDKEAQAAKLAQEQKDKEAQAAKLAQEQKDKEAQAAKLAQEQKDKEAQAAKLAQEQKDKEAQAAKLAQEQKDKEAQAAKLAQEQKDKEARMAAEILAAKAQAKENKINSTLQKAHQAFSNEDYTKAIEIYKQVDQLDPQVSQSHAMQSLSYLRQNNMPENLASLQKAEKISANDPLTLLAKAEKEIFLKNDIVALDLYNKVLNQGDNALALFRLGTASLKNKDIQQAVSYYERAIKAPDFDILERSIKVKLFHNMGISYTSLKKTPQAKNSFIQALKTNPQYTPSNIALGQIQYREKDYISAAVSLGKAVQSEPNNFSALSLLGTTLHMTGNTQGSYKAFSAALAIQPENAMILYNLGSAEVSLGKFDSAIQHLEKSLNIKDSDNTKIQLAIAMVKAKTQYPRAQQLFTEVINKNPQDTSAMKGLIESYDSQKNYKAAIDTINTIKTITPDDTEIWYKEGTILYKQKQYTQAISVFRNLITKEDTPENRYQLATSLFANNNLQEALTEYETLIAKTEKPEYLEAKANTLIKLNRMPEAKITLTTITQKYKQYAFIERVNQKIQTIIKLGS